MDEEQKIPASTPGHGEPVFVEELAGPEDYWLTLTDAARVTRRQEVTIRRWVASGTLPVRRQRLGLNGRTRHVRASDLVRLTPIVDASAAISGVTAQVDLVSIPMQQATILAAHALIEHDLASLHDQITQMAAQLQGVEITHRTELMQIQAHAEKCLQEASTSWEMTARQITQEMCANVAQWAQQEQELREQIECIAEEIGHQQAAIIVQLNQDQATAQATLAAAQQQWQKHLAHTADRLHTAFVEQHDHTQQQVADVLNQIHHLTAVLETVQALLHHQQQTIVQQDRVQQEMLFFLHHTRPVQRRHHRP